MPGLSHTSDLKIGTPVASLPGAWRYRVGAGTGRPGIVSVCGGEGGGGVCVCAIRANVHKCLCVSVHVCVCTCAQASQCSINMSVLMCQASFFSFSLLLLLLLLFCKKFGFFSGEEMITLKLSIASIITIIIHCNNRKKELTENSEQELSNKTQRAKA